MTNSNYTDYVSNFLVTLVSAYKTKKKRFNLKEKCFLITIIINYCILKVLNNAIIIITNIFNKVMRLFTVTLDKKLISNINKIKYYLKIKTFIYFMKKFKLSK